MNLSRIDRLYVAEVLHRLAGRFPNKKNEYLLHAGFVEQGFEGRYAAALEAAETGFEELTAFEHHGTSVPGVRLQEGTLSAAECEEVEHILTVYAECKKAAEWQSSNSPRFVDHKKLKFPGFDPLHEKAQMHFAQLLRRCDPRFRGIDSVHDCRSDRPQLAGYREILKRAAEKGPDGQPLPFDAARILGAGR